MGRQRGCRRSGRQVPRPPVLLRRVRPVARQGA